MAKIRRLDVFIHFSKLNKNESFFKKTRDLHTKLTRESTYESVRMSDYDTVQKVYFFTE